jgi:FtsK/SpoIIIE family
MKRPWPGLVPLGLVFWRELLSSMMGFRSHAERQEHEATLRAEAEMREKEEKLRAQALEYASALQETLTRLNICYRYRKSEADVFDTIQEMTFMKPYSVTPEVIRYKLDTRHLPRGVSCKELEDEYVMRLLSTNCRHRVTFHHNDECGYWLWVETEFGMSGIPRHVAWDEMIAARPAHMAGERLAFPIGIGESHKPIWRTVPEVGNLLIAGSPDSGKSNFANALICTLLKHNRPDQLKLLLVDLKGGLEFSFYSGLSNYLLRIPKPKLKKEKEATPDEPDEGDPETDCAEIDALADEAPGEGDQAEAAPSKTEPDEEIEFTREMVPAFIEDRRLVPAALTWLIGEAERRMQVLKKAECKKIQQFNQKHPNHIMPYVVAVIDEWADVKLDRALGAKCEDKLINISNRARATGIYCYVATQSPNKDVLSIRVKNAMVSRMIFRCADQYMSQGLVGDYGATKIEVRGRGFWVSGRDKFELQTPYIGNETVEHTVAEALGGKVVEITKPKRHDVTDREVYEWALHENNGNLGWREIYSTFAPRKFTSKDAQIFTSGKVGSTVLVDGNFYKIVASTGYGPAKKPVRMLPVDDKSVDRSQYQDLVTLAVVQNSQKLPDDIKAGDNSAKNTEN